MILNSRWIVCLALTTLGWKIALAHEHGSCDGACQSSQPNNRTPYSQQPAAPQYSVPQYANQQYPGQQFLSGPAAPGFSAQGQRAFASPAAHDCPICRAEREGAPAVFSNGYDASQARPFLAPLNPMPRQMGYPLADPDASNRMPETYRREPRPVAMNQSPNEQQSMSLPQQPRFPEQAGIPNGMAFVLQDDSPLMSAGEQLGSIDRGQTLRVLNIQGNWVQLETDWLGKNTWIRRNLVQMNDNIQPPNDIAPPAT